MQIKRGTLIYEESYYSESKPGWLYLVTAFDPSACTAKVLCVHGNGNHVVTTRTFSAPEIKYMQPHGTFKKMLVIPDIPLMGFDGKR